MTNVQTVLGSELLYSKIKEQICPIKSCGGYNEISFIKLVFNT